MSYTRQTSELTHGLQRLGLHTREEVARLDEQDTVLTQRVSEDELSYTRQTSEIVHGLQRLGINTRNEVSRLDAQDAKEEAARIAADEAFEERISEDELSYTRQTSELTVGLQRLDLRTRNDLASEQNARNAAALQLQRNIDIETAERKTLDTRLQDKVDTEEVARKAADEVIVQRMSEDELSYTRQTSEIINGLQRLGLHTRKEVARLDEQDAALTQRVSKDELSYTRQASELTATVQRMGLHARSEVARLDSEVSRLNGEVSRIDEHTTAQEISTGKQMAHLSDTAIDQSRRIDDVYSSLSAFMLYVNERLAQLAHASILQSKRIGIPYKIRDVDVWEDSDDGDRHDFSHMSFTSDEDGTVLLGSDVSFSPA